METSEIWKELANIKEDIGELNSTAASSLKALEGIQARLSVVEMLAAEHKGAKSLRVYLITFLIAIFGSSLGAKIISLFPWH